MAKQPSHNSLPTLFVFLISIFLSASLLFMVQPMAGKMLLPLVGGAPSGWIVALAFFQSSLLIGYIFAHWFSKLPPRGHGLAVVTLLGLGSLFLPMDLGDGVNIEQSSKAAMNVFILLSSAVAIPFIALSSVSSTLQRLFHYAKGTRGRDPYFLYAVSNFGSFLGLLGYPLLVEPFFAVSTQTEYWMFGYITLIGGVLLASLLNNNAKEQIEDSDIIRPAFKTGIYWIALAFVPSSLMVGMTNFVTLEITPIPLFWVLPLALYLLTYIIAFSVDPTKYARTFNILHLIAAPLIAILFIFSVKFIGWTALLLHLICFSIVAMMCHAQLAAVRPHPKYLTAFYLYLAVGGALGGILNAFIAPEIFTKIYEYPLVAIFSLLLSPLLLKTSDKHQKMRRVVFIITVSLIGLFIASLIAVNKHNVFTARNFFGPISVIEKTHNYQGHEYKIRTLNHGTTVHGIEVLEDNFKRSAAYSYYAVLQPFFDTPEYPVSSVGVIGLGAGTLLCYDAPGRVFTAFEIDSEIVGVAREYFNFIDDCSTPENKIIVGDGRLELAKQDRTFDLLVLDAFSSDTIPTHLLTREAFESYFDKMNNNGRVLINISNRYFDLSDTISKITGEFGYKTYERLNRGRDFPPWISASHWLLISKSPIQNEDWNIVVPGDNTKIWTDDYTHVLSTLKGAK